MLAPVGRPAGMRAGIDIALENLSAAHDEDRALAKLEAPAAGIGDLGQAAERRAAHGLMPPQPAISAHCSFVTGTTESRPWRTSLKSASRGSALIRCTGKGVFSASARATSTMPKRPLLSFGSG